MSAENVATAVSPTAADNLLASKLVINLSPGGGDQIDPVSLKPGVKPEVVEQTGSNKKEGINILIITTLLITFTANKKKKKAIQNTDDTIMLTTIILIKKTCSAVDNDTDDFDDDNNNDGDSDDDYDDDDDISGKTNTPRSK